MGEALNAVNIHALGGDDGGDAGELLCRESAAEHGDDKVMLTQAVEPMLERIRSDAGETRLQAKLVGTVSDRGLENREVISGWRFHEHAERQRLMNEGLADVEDDNVVRGEDAGELGGEARGVVSGDVDE